MALLHAHAEDADIQPAPERVQTIEIASRFGSFAFDPALAIATPSGLPGFPSARRFGLADLPDPRHDRFKLLQCLDGPDPAFLVMPIGLTNAPYDAADLDAALSGTNSDAATAALLLVVATRKGTDGKTEVTVNLRAPIILDLANRRARQYVMPNDTYPLRQPL